MNNIINKSFSIDYLYKRDAVSNLEKDLNVPLTTDQKVALAAKLSLPAVMSPLPFSAKTIKEIDTAPLPLVIPGMGTANFEMFEDPASTLDNIPVASHWKSAPTNLDERVRKEIELLAILKPKKPKQKLKNYNSAKKETALGVAIAGSPRKNCRMTIELSETAKKEWGRDKIVSDAIYAKNNPIGIKGTVTSSFSRLADTVSLLRAIKNPDGSSDCYAGRVDTLPKAEEMARFIFLSEIDQFEKGNSKGLVERPDGTFELTFATQSLLNMVGSEKKLFDQEVNAYEELGWRSQRTPLEIKHPITGKVYQVAVNPIPVAAMPSNWIYHVEKADRRTKGFIKSGKAQARVANAKADAVLEKLVQQKVAELKQKNDWSTAFQLTDAFAALKGQKLRAWQEVMTRGYVLHLLGIPEVLHCKSSCDRTGGFAIPLVFAMKEWLRAGKPIPKVDGKYCIHAIMENDSVKELVAAKLQQEVKTSEYSRGSRGLKVNEKGIPNPAFKRILPDRYLNRSLKRHKMTTLNLDAPEIKDRSLVAGKEKGENNDD